ncbi:Photosystem I reaction center subunit III [Stenomitos frigidus]|uniref:Photosystem I reaction center subunit III n=1 Tax=Stenomitos frigidus ULC18 TaxID=2107698 RepID=A0A2T1DV15_9CYAN|nr:Photosystem I reaction center subunit III [Stenomitos frigidus]PSB24338.1 Photosystem I reaction center subunit III [Stenomitos frigidus ULC18]
MQRLFALVLVVMLWFGFVSIPPASASNLTPCKDSAAFAQRAKDSISATAKQRFDFYANSGVLCGEEGLPHLVVDPTAAHAGEFAIPSILFLYIAGWIGWVGRAYLQAIKKGSNPEQDEIIINVPLALKFALSGFAWPLAAIKEFTTGELTAKDDEITVSVR